MKNMNTKGFTLVEVLLIVLIISVLGFAGYYAYTQNNVDQDSSTTTSQETNDSEEEEDSDQSTYESSATGLTFNYPDEWGDVTEENLATTCEADGVVGEKYKYTFSQKEAYIMLPSQDFSFDGVNHCLGEDPRISYNNKLTAEQTFHDENGLTVFAQTDSCIGAVENSYINAYVRPNSQKFQTVGVYHLDKYKLSPEESKGFCEGSYSTTTQGLDYSEELRQFLNSLAIK